MKKVTPKSKHVTSFKDPVLVLRTCDKDLKSHGGFQWPASGYVEAPDFKPTEHCGNGLHGLLDGEGDWDLMNWEFDAKAMIVETDRSQIINLSGKVKFQSGIVKKVASLAELLCSFVCDSAKIRKQVQEIKKAAGIETAASGHSSMLAASGDSSKLAASGHYSKLAASGHYSKLAASGHYSKLAASGDSSKLAASGDSSQLAASGHYSKLAASGHSSQLAASGDYSQLAASGHSSQLAASGHYSQLAASGHYSVVMAASKGCIAKVGKDGAIALRWNQGDKPRIAVAYVGENGIKPNTFYRLNENGEFVEA
jgi:hypothetical protein